MIEKLHSNNIFTDGKRFAGYVCYDDERGKITYAGKADTAAFDRETELGDAWLMPGFIDTHTHGAAGFDYSADGPEGIVHAVNTHFAHGVTAVLPTVLTQDHESLRRALANIRAAKESGAAKAEILGAHIEGPYLSPAQAGAQNKAFITAPMPEEYARLAAEFGDVIKKWTYAPERDDGTFCSFCVHRGILPSAGHTDATQADFARAHAAGCRGITHLYSCTSTITRAHGYRRLGVTECAYLYDDVYFELIADGKHVPPELLRLAFKLKPSRRIMLVSDSLAATESAATSGNLGGVPFVVEDGVAKLVDRTAFAGSVATADRLVNECILAGIAAEKAIEAVTRAPAEYLGIKKGSLRAGFAADMVTAKQNADKTITVTSVTTHGKKREAKGK